MSSLKVAKSIRHIEPNPDWKRALKARLRLITLPLVKRSKAAQLAPGKIKKMLPKMIGFLHLDLLIFSVQVLIAFGAKTSAAGRLVTKICLPINPGTKVVKAGSIPVLVRIMPRIWMRRKKQRSFICLLNRLFLVRFLSIKSIKLHREMFPKEFVSM